MLQLKTIKKDYFVSKELTVNALKGISLAFRENEFVSILGPSGCGKTSLLNIIGGLDRYTSGDLLINGKSTKHFKDKDWDAYRNHSIGFVFQNYNLISHITVVENVELSLKISGLSQKDRRQKAIEVLKKVGLEDQIKKRPNQLSGGQMQRVAIARSLVNDPDIILADEPTGALDSETSLVVMNLLKEIAKEKLVIMVTHNNELADKFSDRIIRLLDGEIISDSNAYQVNDEVTDTMKLSKTKMSYWTALGLSGKNLISKRWRTLLISFAGSIGIIGIALVLAISNGMNRYISDMQRDSLNSMPITISKTAINLDSEALMSMNDTSKLLPTDGKLVIESPRESMMHANSLNQGYIDYVNAMDASLLRDLTFDYGMNLNLLTPLDDQYQLVETQKVNFTQLPKEESVFTDVFEVIEGEMIQGTHDLVIMVDPYNRVSSNVLRSLGYAVDEDESIELSDLVGKTFHVIDNDDFYTEVNGLYVTPKASDYASLYESSSTTYTIVGVVRAKADFVDSAMYSSGVFYREALMNEQLSQAKQSAIVKAQIDAGTDKNVLTGMSFDFQASASGSKAEDLYNNVLAGLGGSNLPVSISITPKDFESKAKVVDYLNAYNIGKDEADTIEFTDISSMFTGVMTNMVDTVSYVLIAFSAISLIVSSLMIGIITYVSVIERTKEIGVLRSLGARKKDISRVFNAETIIIGIFAGTLGVLITYALTFPINSLINNLIAVEGIAEVNPVQALVLVIISMFLTLISGLIPARIAAKKDPVEALRTE